MVITYYGISCFKLQSGDLVLATDPYSKETGLTPPRFQTNIITVSSDEAMHNNVDALNSKSENELFVINCPGEYETNGIRIKGIQTKGSTIYAIEWEGMKLVHLGSYKEKTMRDEIVEQIGTPDILFIPVGGNSTISHENAAKIVNDISPRVVIPMYFKIENLKTKLEPIDSFLKEMGEKIKSEEKFTVKKNSLPSAEESQIVVLETAI
jgi:L-ascorbate metabolism protein UlaG (beta-lactamase superfamily)